jgi:hypothetical protein
MEKLKTGLASYLGSAAWWVCDKIWGDRLFAIVKPMLPDVAINGVPLADVARFGLSYGPPFALVLIGTILFISGRRQIASIASGAVTTSLATAEDTQSPAPSLEPVNVTANNTSTVKAKPKLIYLPEERARMIVALTGFYEIIHPRCFELTQSLINQKFQTWERDLRAGKALEIAGWLEAAKGDVEALNREFNKVMDQVSVFHEELGNIFQDSGVQGNLIIGLMQPLDKLKELGAAQSSINVNRYVREDFEYLYKTIIAYHEWVSRSSHKATDKLRELRGVS